VDHSVVQASCSEWVVRWRWGKGGNGQRSESLALRLRMRCMSIGKRTLDAWKSLFHVYTGAGSVSFDDDVLFFSCIYIKGYIVRSSCTEQTIEKLLEL
jgi:hypothetical protein